MARGGGGGGGQRLFFICFFLFFFAESEETDRQTDTCHPILFFSRSDLMRPFTHARQHVPSRPRPQAL